MAYTHLPVNHVLEIPFSSKYLHLVSWFLRFIPCSSLRLFIGQMDGRRQTHPSLVQPPGMMHRHVGTSKEKLSAQVAEVERLSADRRTLALAHVALRQEVAAAHQEIEKFRDRIKDISMGSDIGIGVLRDKIAKLAVEIKARDSVKNELQQTQMMVIQLLADKRELNARVKHATEELEQAHVGLKSLSEKHRELHSLRQEHQMLRTNFEYERAVNLEKIGQMQAMEKNLLGMSREVETLRNAIITAENDASLSYADPHTQTQPLYQPPIHTNGIYVDIYGRPYAQMVVATTAEGTAPYGSGNS